MVSTKRKYLRFELCDEEEFSESKKFIVSKAKLFIEKDGKSLLKLLGLKISHQILTKISNFFHRKGKTQVIHRMWAFKQFYVVFYEGSPYKKRNLLNLQKNLLRIVHGKGFKLLKLKRRVVSITHYQDSKSLKVHFIRIH